MVGQWTTTKPSRSDEVLDADEQIRIANQIRAQFDALAPNRPIKPNRSEPDPYPVDSTLSLHNIPELDKFHSLQSASTSKGIISAEGSVDVQDEFVETHYYTELASVDKQHHTTGSGFINPVTEGGESGGGYEIPSPATASLVDAGEINLPGSKCNPATNDWVPVIHQHQAFLSSKPNRSESS